MPCVAARVLRGWSARLGAIVILAALACALAPWAVVGADPQAQELSMRLRAPMGPHWLGTDQLGRDILARVVHGARVTMLVSGAAVLVAGVVGVLAGLVAGYFGGWLDAVILRLIDIQLAFPLILLVIAVVAVLGPSLANLIVIMGLSGWPRFARIVRGSVLAVRSLDYVEAARSIGAGRPRILARHVLPNVASAIIVYASFELARMILLEATLSFLGLGVQPPTPTWGGMINDGRRYLNQSWYVSLVPGVAIAALILAYNLIGDALRDALDPQLKDT